MAGFFERLGNMVKGTGDKWLDQHEDPITVMEQKIAKGVEEYGELRAAHKASVNKVEKAEEAVKLQESNVAKYQRIAEVAVEKGEEADALEACDKLDKYEALLKTAQETLAREKDTERSLSSDVLDFANSIEKAKIDLNNMRSMVASAEAKEAKADFSDGFMSDGNSALERAKAKVEARLAAAEAKDGMASGPAEDPLLAKYGEETSGAAARLAAIKKAKGLG